MTEHYDDGEVVPPEEEEEMTEEEEGQITTVSSIEDPIEKQNAADELSE